MELFSIRIQRTFQLVSTVEQKVKVEIPFILYLGTVCSIILLAIVVYIYVAIKL